MRVSPLCVGYIRFYPTERTYDHISANKNHQKIYIVKLNAWLLSPVFVAW